MDDFVLSYVLCLRTGSGFFHLNLRSSLSRSPDAKKSSKEDGGDNDSDKSGYKDR